MSDVWDRTMEVMRGRVSMLATIAFLLSFLPQVAQYALTGFVPGHSVAHFTIVAVATLLVLVLAVWSGLALVAGASNPATDRSGALAIGVARLPTAIGLSLLSLLAVAIVLVPFGALIGASGISPAMLARPGARPDLSGISPGAVGGAMLYLFAVVLPLALWAGARLAVFTPVLVNERLGLRTFARSWRLTRGLAWRIVGVFVLFIILYSVVAGAAQLVVTLVFRLVLGAQGSGTALFFGAVATSAAAAAFGVVTATFTAQLYRTLTGREAAETFA